MELGESVARADILGDSWARLKAQSWFLLRALLSFSHTAPVSCGTAAPRASPALWGGPGGAEEKCSSLQMLPGSIARAVRCLCSSELLLSDSVPPLSAPFLSAPDTSVGARRAARDR